MTEHKEVEPTKHATPDATLLGELMNPNVAKSEREHMAARHIEHLNQLLDLFDEPNTTTIPTAEYEQLIGRIKDLEAQIEHQRAMLSAIG